jgi:hypothetical protein
MEENDMDNTAYELALILVQEIDRRLERGFYFTDCYGRPMFKFDQVLGAIDEGRWPVFYTSVPTGGKAMSEEKFTHTVHCFDDKTLRKHFAGIEAATEYANKLLEQGHKVRIYPYKPARRYVDILVERGPNG